MNKNDLRIRLREVRRAVLPAVRVQKSKKIAETFLKMEAVADAGSILFYVSTGEEVDTRELIKWFFRTNVRIFVPKVSGEELEIHQIHDSNDLRIGEYGILEPALDGDPIDPGEADVIVVPGIGFDKSGNRIGSGKGFYDRLLKKTRGSKIGLAFSEQIVDELPVEEQDVPVNIVVTDSQIIHP